MNNLFIVNTPYHLLTSFILSQSFTPNENITNKIHQNNNETINNYLIIIRATNYSSWKNNSIMSYLSSKKCGYTDVFPLIHFLSRFNQISYRKQVENLKKTFYNIHFDNVFLGNDLEPKNQLLLATLNITHFNRFEDGLYSYYDRKIYHNILNAYFNKFKIFIQKKLYGINGKIYINTLSDGSSKAGISDYLYNPNLLEKSSPCPINIKTTTIFNSLSTLKTALNLKAQFKQKTILFFGQPFVERNLLSIECELYFLNTISKFCKKNNINFLYKPPPYDNKEKITKIKYNIPNIIIYNSIEPAEILYFIESNLISVISYQSTALIHINKFSNHIIKAISLIDLTNIPIDNSCKKIMHSSNVYFPTNIHDLIHHLSN